MTRQKVELLIIDPQIDFCDPAGALYVLNAETDAIRLSTMIERLRNEITDIHVTLDSHHLVHIAHPIFWVDQEENHPPPFTIISEQDLKAGKWRTKNPVVMERAFNYVRDLAKNNRYLLCIWPPHCLIGSRGHNVYPIIYNQLMQWESLYRIVEFVTKGSNPYTEHYSAVQADVPADDDKTTSLNINLIKTIESADIIGLSGQALSHCVANTVRDIANNFGDDSIKKLVLLEDTTSPVGDLPGSNMFKKMAEDFINEMTGRGMRVMKSTDFLK